MNCIKCNKETTQEIHVPSPEKHPVKDTSYYVPIPLCADCLVKFKLWLKVN